jgi:hypothetical protein
MLENQEFINSFRYSFLLIESLYGNGQFKTPSLQAALKSNQEFRNIVDLAIKDMIQQRMIGIRIRQSSFRRNQMQMTLLII